ncbi:MAG: hypothetical protein WD361_02205 [Gracilimonas sp.]
MTYKTNILIYGYGNPGRQDDGLAKMLIDKAEAWVEKKRFKNVSLDVNYQLQVEDITDMYDKDLVIFADASMEENVEDFLITPLTANDQATFSMHAVAPAYLLALCQKIYGLHPLSYLLHIRGYEWNLNEEITPEALQNLDKAWETLQLILNEPELFLEKPGLFQSQKSLYHT